MLHIRTETKQDHERVYQLVTDAFLTAEHRDGTEQDLVVLLRAGDSFVPALSLIAEQDGQIAGYALFTETRLSQTPAVILAPLAVGPAFQRQGVGTALLHKGHDIARALGYEVSLVVGSEKYYPRLGYRPASEFGITAPFAVPDQNFMALILQGEAKKYDCTAIFAKELTA